MNIKRRTEAFDNMSEIRQGSDAGEIATSNIDYLDSAIVDVESAISSLESIE